MTFQKMSPFILEQIGLKSLSSMASFRCKGSRHKMGQKDGKKESIMSSIQLMARKPLTLGIIMLQLDLWLSIRIDKALTIMIYQLGMNLIAPFLSLFQGLFYRALLLTLERIRNFKELLLFNDSPT